MKNDNKSNNSKKQADDNLSKNSKKENKEVVKEVGNPKETEDKNNQPEKGKGNLGSTRSYLESTVVNAVMQGMAEIAKNRPNNPLEYLGNYLINKSKEQP